MTDELITRYAASLERTTDGGVGLATPLELS